MCYRGFDASLSHTASRSQACLIGNTSQLITYKQWRIWLSKVTSRYIHQMNVVESNYKFAEKWKYLGKVPKNSTWERFLRKL